MSLRPDFFIKRGDRLPALQTTLLNNGAPIDLEGLTVRFKMRRAFGGSLRVDAAAQIVNPPGNDGMVRYDWAAGDTDIPGWYESEWEIQFDDGKTLSVPNDRFDVIAVLSDVS